MVEDTWALRSKIIHTSMEGSKDTGTGLWGGNKVGKRCPSSKPSVYHSFWFLSDPTEWLLFRAVLIYMLKIILKERDSRFETSCLITVHASVTCHGRMDCGPKGNLLHQLLELGRTFAVVTMFKRRLLPQFKPPTYIKSAIYLTWSMCYRTWFLWDTQPENLTGR